MSTQPYTVIQITDCHLAEAKGGKLLAMDPDESLTDVLNVVNSHHQSIDLLIATGDLANEPSPSAYQRLHQTLLSQIDAPLGWLPGNHDVPEIMRSVDDDINVQHHIVGRWLFIMLNSRVEGQTHGYLEEKELALCEELFQRYPDKHLVVCLHHQPIPVGSEWMDQYIVRNADAFWSLIDRCATVKAVVWGHVHQEFRSSRNGIQLLATPSTCLQFTPKKQHFHIDTTMPGYRWFVLYDDGRWQSGVRRAPIKDYGIDPNAQGY